MYTMESRVRYSEVGENNVLAFASIINYFQDCSSMQSEELGVGVDYLRETNRCWILSSWQIEVERYPIHGEQIRVKTWPCEMKGFFGGRNYVMEDAAGTTLARAYSLWVYMDTVNMRPVKIDEKMSSAYEYFPPLQMEWEGRKIAVPQIGDDGEKFRVQHHDLDTNHHVNNGKYVLMAQDYLPESFQIRKMRAEYKNAAVLGDVICPRVSIEEKKVTVVLSDEKKAPYAVICFEE